MYVHNAEGAVAENSQAEGPDFDETLESKGAPKKENLSGLKTEAHRNQIKLILVRLFYMLSNLTI